MSATTRTLIKPLEEEEVSPYRPVWRSILVLVILLAIIGVVGVVVFRLLGLTLPGGDAVRNGVNVALLLLPTFVWLLAFVLPERSVTRPRRKLITVFVITGLMTSGAALPITTLLLQPETWLPTVDVVTRIVGYTITTGILQAAVQYLVLRYALSAEDVRIHADGGVYGITSAIAYSVVITGQMWLASPTLRVDAMMAMILHIYASALVGGFLIGYGIVELRTMNPIPLLVPFLVILTAFATGAGLALRSNFVNASFGIAGGFSSPLFGFIVSLGILVVAVVCAYLLITGAQRRLRELGSDAA